jgi:PhzF family phenazine biosynthesis protein
MSTEILRYAAFTDRPEGGNPAGVVLDASGLDDAAMQEIAADVGYSETAFVTGEGTDVDVRYFSPLAEVPFCGHATIATGVAWGERHGAGVLRMRTPAGLVEVTVRDGEGASPPVATLVSVAPRSAPLADEDRLEALAALGWSDADLDPALPPRVAYAGAHHPVLAVAEAGPLESLDYDFDRLGALMAARDWTTMQLVLRVDAATFRPRNPFPPGGVVEDPATGAAAAAFGGYLRELGLVETPATITIHQGVELGRPSLLTVDIPPGDSGIAVTGAAVPIED